MGEHAPHSREETARKAGVGLDDIDRLVELGLLSPGPGDTFSRGDVLRTRWILGFQRAGVPLERMSAAVAEGGLSFAFMDAAVFDRFAGHSDTTFQQLSDRTGVPVELLMMVREASGSGEPSPEDQVRHDELAIVPAIELQLSEGFRPVVIERWLRACGDALSRIVETEVDWWRTEVARQTHESIIDADQHTDLGVHMAALAEQALVAIYHGQQEHAWSTNAAETVEAALERAGLISRQEHPPAMCFLDIAGYTRLTEERGDEAAADVAATVSTLVRRSSHEHGGQPVKWLGDGVMLFFRDPGRGVIAALDMLRGLATHDLPSAHVGLHAGPVVFQEGDYFGRTVNVAARIGEYARPGEVLVSQEVVDAAEGTPVRFTPIGPVVLRGVSGALRLHVASSGR